MNKTFTYETRTIHVTSTVAAPLEGITKSVIIDLSGLLTGLSFLIEDLPFALIITPRTAADIVSKAFSAYFNIEDGTTLREWLREAISYRNKDEVNTPEVIALIEKALLSINQTVKEVIEHYIDPRDSFDKILMSLDIVARSRPYKGAVSIIGVFDIMSID